MPSKGRAKREKKDSRQKKRQRQLRTEKKIKRMLAEENTIGLTEEDKKIESAREECRNRHLKELGCALDQSSSDLIGA